MCDEGCRMCRWCAPTTCHCGQPFVYGFDDDPTHTRGMCAHCDAVRCDAYPGECGRGVGARSA